MLEFLNPGYLLAGSALVSLPIAIHLINRLRYKRVRWAAMEFLLKSQKRNKRRLLLEQLLLLALRCFLVLLAVTLVSRYLLAFFQPQNTIHVVLLDDSLSMQDQWKVDGLKKDSFGIGKDLVAAEIAKNAMQAKTAQRLVLLFASDPATPRFDQRLNDETMRELQKILADAECTQRRLDIRPAVEAARPIFDKNALDRRMLHIVGDFRQRDWGETEAGSLSNGLESLAVAGIKINFIDTAHPSRGEGLGTPLFHDNLAVVELLPQTRIAAKDSAVQFSVTLANNGVAERKNVRVTVKVNGGERSDASRTFLSVPPGKTTETFFVTFDQLGSNQVTANLEEDETGLTADNTAYAVVEVRKQVPVLVIDGQGTAGQKPGGDLYHVDKVLSSARSYQVVPRAVNELEQASLDQYASIFLLNVKEFSDKALNNLEEFLRDGGSVAFFLGDRVNPEFYTNKLYAGGKGIFPAPLADRPFPPTADPEMVADLFDNQFKAFVRKDNHPIVAKLAQPRVKTFLKFLPIKRYYPVPRNKWDMDPSRVEELVTLPNQNAVQNYAAAAQELLDKLGQLAQEPKNAAAKTTLETHIRGIRDKLTDKPLHELANALDALLHDRGDPSDQNSAGLADFWDNPEQRPLRARVERLRETVQLGDPMIVTGRYGKGSVVAVMTTAGTAWNEWGGGSAASVVYPIFIAELQNFLTSATAHADLYVGKPLDLQLDASRYDAKVQRFYVPEAKDEPGKDNVPRGPVDLREQLATVSGGRMNFAFEEARQPGLYLFDFTRRGDDGGSAPARTEQRAFVFNLDPAEGELKRTAGTDLENLAKGSQVRVPGSGWAAELADRRSDLSESGWFYLLFLLILLAEQALAVHLSFHLSSEEGTTKARHAPAAAGS